MKNTLRAFAFLLQFATLGLAMAFVVSRLWPQAPEHLRGESTTEPSSSPPPTTDFTMRERGPVSYAEAVARAAPAVANIYANKVITAQTYRVFPQPDLQRLFGGISLGPALQRREQSLGSGVIVSTDGYVLTNNHVISGADDIQLLLYDGRIAKAKVVGNDRDTDLAVLKIDAANLPTVTMAVAPLNVGDVVLAIGNPFGFGKTVTLGIVSALGRQLNLSTFEDFIQTDAAINAGNSGGALVNAYGDLVGINTAYYRQQASAEGIGFAIPAATAKAVLDQIIAHGMVIRGWLGAEYGPVQVAADSGLPAAARGAMVLDIYPGSPASRSGLQAGDVLLKLDGDDIAGPGELRTREAALTPGTVIKLVGLRAGAPFAAEAVLVQRPVLNQVRIPSP